MSAGWGIYASTIAALRHGHAEKHVVDGVLLGDVPQSHSDGRRGQGGPSMTGAPLPATEPDRGRGGLDQNSCGRIAGPKTGGAVRGGLPISIGAPANSESRSPVPRLERVTAAGVATPAMPAAEPGSNPLASSGRAGPANAGNDAGRFPAGKHAGPADDSDGLEWLRAILISAAFVDVMIFTSQGWAAAAERMGAGWLVSGAVFSLAVIGIAAFGLICIRPHSIAGFRPARTSPARSPRLFHVPKPASLAKASGSGVVIDMRGLLRRPQGVIGAFAYVRQRIVKAREIVVPNLFCPGVNDERHSS